MLNFLGDHFPPCFLILTWSEVAFFHSLYCMKASEILVTVDLDLIGVPLKYILLYV